MKTIIYNRIATFCAVAVSTAVFVLLLLSISTPHQAEAQTSNYYGGNYNNQYQQPYWWYWRWPYYQPPYQQPPQYAPLRISCSPNTSNVMVGASVQWRAYPSGGTGSYSYSWSGEGIYSESNSSNAVAYYSYPGSKYAYVTVTSGNQVASAYCGNVYVQQPYIQPYPYPYPYPYPRPW
ncbi:MAG: hypothetical protein V4524_00665 [Patescibacteria group bacterium]